MLRAAGYVVTINADRPRKGAFVVRIEGVEAPVIELLDMPRPFVELKGTDVAAVVQAAL